MQCVSLCPIHLYSVVASLIITPGWILVQIWRIFRHTKRRWSMALPFSLDMLTIFKIGEVYWLIEFLIGVLRCTSISSTYICNALQIFCWLTYKATYEYFVLSFYIAVFLNFLIPLQPMHTGDIRMLNILIQPQFRW